jgi:long-chain acyl-CoA synthetase
MTDTTKDNLGYWCSEAVARYPERVAMIDLCGKHEREVTYRELEERLNRFASLIVAAGLARGDRMAMAVNNRFEFVEVMYGAMRAGIVPVPLNTKLGRETLAYVVEDSGCRAVVVEPDCNPFIVDVIEQAGIGARFAFDPAPPGWQAYEPALMAPPTTFEPPALGPDHMSFLPYTSGSTGRPKGVVLTHAGQLSVRG